MYCFTVLEVRSSKSVSLNQNYSGGRIVLSPEALEEHLLDLSNFWWLQASLCMGLITLNFKASIFKSLSALSSHWCIHYVCKISLCISLIGIMCWFLRHTGIIQNTLPPQLLNLITSARTLGYFTIWGYIQMFQGLGCRYLLGSHFSASPQCNYNINSYTEKYYF